MPVVDIRCPNDSRRLFLKLMLSGETPNVVNGQYLEISCADCTRIERKKNPEVLRVLHYYLASNGTPVSSRVVLNDDSME